MDKEPALAETSITHDAVPLLSKYTVSAELGTEKPVGPPTVADQLLGSDQTFGVPNRE